MVFALLTLFLLIHKILNNRKDHEMKYIYNIYIYLKLVIYYAKRKYPDTKKYILYESCIWNPNTSKTAQCRQKADSGWQLWESMWDSVGNWEENEGIFHGEWKCSTFCGMDIHNCQNSMHWTLKIYAFSCMLSNLFF